jgi:plastocyanin
MMAGRSHRRQLWLPAVAAMSWLVLTGGGSFAATVQPKAEGATCSPSGTSLSITAFDNKFDKKCLAAPADQAFTIEFQNLDRGIPHNLAIYADQTAQKALFKGDLVDGPGKATYSVQGIPAGTFFFQCDPHPEMNGTFIAG